MTTTPEKTGQSVDRPVDHVTVTIDGIQVSVPKDTLVIRAAEQVGVPEHPGGQRAGAVAQLEGEIRGARPRDQPVLAAARVDTGDVVTGTQRAEVCDRHPPDDGVGAGRCRPLP